MNDLELDSLTTQGYRPGDLIGRSGVERSYEDLLRGTRTRVRPLPPQHPDPAPGRLVYEVPGNQARLEQPVGDFIPTLSWSGIGITALRRRWFVSPGNAS